MPVAPRVYTDATNMARLAGCLTIDSPQISEQEIVEEVVKGVVAIQDLSRNVLALSRLSSGEPLGA